LNGQKEKAMADQRTADLPEGTDTIIEPVAPQNSGAIVTDRAAQEEGSETLTIDDPGLPSGKLSDRIRTGREQFSSQAGEKARGFVTQGLERTSEALANVSKMVGDTADGIEERLGPEYGDYARRAAGAIENAANTLASKDPDELIEDTRNFVRNSPGIALAGAAVVGFVVARLVKSGLASNSDDDD
jgi:ElaB/YqjD/DUF883 family membrane-anchored ribosome-binding protein